VAGLAVFADSDKTFANFAKEIKNDIIAMDEKIG